MAINTVLADHKPNLATLLIAIEEWQGQLFELVVHTTSDEEIARLGALLGRAHIMRDQILRLRVEELARAVYWP